MGHLKNAVRTQWRPGFDLRPQKINIVVKTLANLGLLLGLLVGMGVMFVCPRCPHPLLTRWWSGWDSVTSLG
jgi:hypothetical protein